VFIIGIIRICLAQGYVVLLSASPKYLFLIAKNAIVGQCAHMSSISGCSLPDGKEGIKNNLIFDPYDGKDDRINMHYGLKHYYQLSR
jgi:hypothetical protein